MTNELFSINPDATLEQLSAEKEKLQAEKDELADLIERDTGSPSEMAATRKDHRKITRRIEMVERLLGQKRRSEQQVLEKRFVDVARDRLDQETFKTLMAEAIKNGAKGA